MKKLFVLALFSFFAISAFAQQPVKNIAVADSSQKIIKVEMACGQCKFGMEGKGCSLAVKIKDKTYFVDGAGINDFGDAHAEDGFCEAVRKGEAQGKVVNNRFVATYMKLLVAAKK
jgi:Family of unknown function (DUF6370)